MISTSAAFDFTNPEMVEWYKGLVKNVVKDGVGVIKTDFSEALPLDAVYHDGSNGLQGHNKLPPALRQDHLRGLRRGEAARRGAAHAVGPQRLRRQPELPGQLGGRFLHPREQLGLQLRSGLSIGLPACPSGGHDIGGFYNTDSDGYECPPTEQQYVRSAQFGLLSPL